MSNIGKPERETQNRVIALFREELGYRYLGLYVNGIRQLLSNQQKEFNELFFTTVQIVFAGNDSEGLRYGAIKTEEKYFMKWKEDEQDDTRFKLDKYLLKMCRKDRLIELMHDFVLFDGGVKKLPRVHQYFCVKASQSTPEPTRAASSGTRRAAAKAS